MIYTDVIICVVPEFAMIIKNLVPGCRSTVATGAAVEDDPQRRRPDIAVAEANLHWTPKVRYTYISATNSRLCPKINMYDAEYI